MIRQMARILAVVLALRGVAAQEVSYDFVSISPGVRELFLDDYMIGGIYRVTRRIQRPGKGGIVLRADRPWERTLRRGARAPSELVEFHSSPVWDRDEQV